MERIKHKERKNTHSRLNSIKNWTNDKLLKTLSENSVWPYTILDTWWNSQNIIIMFSNFNCSFPIATWDYLESDKEDSISSYGNGISPFTQALWEISSQNTKTKDYRIIEFNYANTGDFDVDDIVNHIVSYLDLKDKNITLYWQSMWWKTALIVASKLISKWYQIWKIVLNSSVIEPDSIALPIRSLPSGIEAFFLKILSLVPSKYLIGILSAGKNDKNLELNREELVKIANNVKWYHIKWKQLKSRLNFMKENIPENIWEYIKEKNIPILVLRSIPVVKNKKPADNDWLIKHSFVDQLEKMFPWQIIVEDIIDAWHSQVPEQNNKYATWLKTISSKL